HARAGDDLRRRRRKLGIPSPGCPPRRALARRLCGPHRHARQEPFFGARRARHALEPAVRGRAQADEARPMKEYLAPGRAIDSDHPAVVAFARQHASGATERDKAVALYYAVRDAIRYNPFLDFSKEESYRGSRCLASGEGFCVGKAALLAA